MVDNTEEALGTWGRFKEAVTRPDDYEFNSIYDMPRNDFMAYLPELSAQGLNADDLLRAYNAKNNATAGLQGFLGSPSQAINDSGRERALGGILSYDPNAGAGVDRVRSIGFEPRAMAQDALSSLLGMGQNVYNATAGRLPADDVQGAAFDAANLVTGLGAASAGRDMLGYDPNTMRAGAGRATVLEADEIIFEWEKGNMTNPELRARMREAGFPIQNKRISPNATGADIEVVGPSDELLTWDKVPVDFDPTTAGVKPQDRSPTPRFNEEALAAARKQNDASREILVDMPIDDFLSAAKTGVDDSKLAGTRALVAEGTPFGSVPSLSFRNNGDGTGQVTGHEGRHRALALKEQGDTTIPVLITSQGGSGPAIRWGKQLDPDDFDYVDNIPTRLIEEEGSSVVPMPDSILNLRSNSSNKAGYAQGGVVKQMNKMYDEGGLATDGMDVDPVSGNDIPVGSNAEDVRDDVDAKLSSGEYVVPADVVKYLGVAQLEKLVRKAKDGLEDMAENGRMGGEPVEDDMSDMEEEYTLGADLGNLDGYAAGGLVEGMDYEALIDRVKSAAMKDPSITNMLKAKGIFIQEPQPQGAAQQAAMETGAVPTQAAPPAIEGQAMPAAFAEGGMVYGEGAYTPTNYASSYNPYEHTMGFSTESGVTGKAPGTPYQPEADVQPTCPEGYTWNPELKVCMPIENKATTSPSGRSDSSAPVAGPKANPNAWMDKYDYTNPETLFNQSMTTIGVSGEGEEEEKSTWLESLGGAAKGLLSGGLIGKFVNTNKAAQMAANAITLRAMGRDDLADQLDAQYDTFVKEKGLELVPESWRDGDRLAAKVKEVKGADWSTDATQRAASSGGGSSAAPKPLVTRPEARPATGSKSASDRLSDVSSNASNTNTVKVASGAKKIVDDAAKAGKTVTQQVQATKPKTTYTKNDSKSTGGPTKASQGSSKGMSKGGLVTPRKKK